MAKISSSAPSPKKSRQSEEDPRAKGTSDVEDRKAKGKGESRTRGHAQVTKPEPDRFVIEEKSTAKAKSVGRESTGGAERISPSSTPTPKPKLQVNAGLSADERRANESTQGDGKTVRDPDDVKVRGERVSVYTSATAARRGERAKSPSLDEAQSSARAAIDEEKAAGRVKVSLDTQGILKIKGSDRSDNITVDRAVDTVTVRSGDKTLGSYAASEVQKVKIEARRGDDRVNLMGLEGTAISVKTGRGDDVARVLGTKGALVKTGRGADRVELAGTRGAVVKTGDGADTVRDVASRGLRIEAGAGADRLRLTESLDSEVRGGAGRDKAVLLDVDNVATTKTRVLARTSPAPVTASYSSSTGPSLPGLEAASSAEAPGDVAQIGAGVMARAPRSSGASVPSPSMATPRRGLSLTHDLPGEIKSPRPAGASPSLPRPSLPSPSLPSPSQPVNPPTVELPQPRRDDVFDLVGDLAGDLGAGMLHPGPGRPPVSVGRHNDPLVVGSPPSGLAPSFGPGTFSPSPGQGVVSSGDDGDDVLGFSP